MSDIEWKDGAVCYANGEQWFERGRVGALFNFNENYSILVDTVIARPDFQLNDLKIGDYISKSELDTEDKYNKAVEVFGLFGFKPNSCFASYSDMHCDFAILIEDGVLYQESEIHPSCNIKITYNQLMAIGELKRLMCESEIDDIKCYQENFSHFYTKAKERSNLDTDLGVDNIKSPTHYQLMDGVESIEIIARSMTKEQWKGFCLGNMLKYRIRAGKKDALQQDIDKADFYGELYEMHKGKCYD